MSSFASCPAPLPPIFGRVRSPCIDTIIKKKNLWRIQTGSCCNGMKIWRPTPRETVLKQNLGRGLLFHVLILLPISVSLRPFISMINRSQQPHVHPDPPAPTLSFSLSCTHTHTHTHTHTQALLRSLFCHSSGKKSSARVFQTDPVCNIHKLLCQLHVCQSCMYNSWEMHTPVH